MTNSIAPQIQTAVLFQPTAPTETQGQATSSRASLSNIEPLKGKVTPLVLPETGYIATMKPSMNRLLKMAPTTIKDGISAARSIWKGTLGGAITGFCTGGPQGLALGAFLGGLLHTLNNAVKGFQKALKEEVLQAAAEQIADSNRAEAGNASKEFNSTTLNYTNKYKTESLDLSKLGDKLLEGAEPKIATIMLNAKNNFSRGNLQKLNLAKNGLGLNEKFVANLIAHSSNKASKEINLGTEEEPKLKTTVHGLNNITIDLQNSGLRSADLLEQELNKLEVGEELQITKTNAHADGVAVQVSFFQPETDQTVNINLNLDSSFKMSSSANEVAQTSNSTQQSNAQLEAPFVSVHTTAVPDTEEHQGAVSPRTSVFS